MIFEKELLRLSILDVLCLKQTNIRCANAGRHFDALSFRLCADARLETPKGICAAPSCTVAYVPAGLDYKRVAKVDEMIVIHFQTDGYVGREIELFSPKDHAAFSKLFLEIFDVWQQKKDGYRYRAAALFYEIFALCYAENCKKISPYPKMQASLDYLLAHYKDEDFSVSAAAKASFISEVYFRRLFKAAFGTSPQKYVIELRMQHAVSLMAAGYYSLKEIAFACGYGDYKYFCTEFKRLKGISPSKYVYNFKG